MLTHQIFKQYLLAYWNFGVCTKWLLKNQMSIAVHCIIPQQNTIPDYQWYVIKNKKV